MRREAVIRWCPEVPRSVFRRAGPAVLIAVSALSLSMSAQAQSLEDEIRAALQPPPSPSRSVGMAAPAGSRTDLKVDPKPDGEDKARAAADRRLVDTLRSRSITIEPAAPPTATERAQVYAIASVKPAIDLEILFDSGSAVIGARATPALAALGQVLSRPEFRGQVFFINGYTDAKGPALVNQRLSQRRADAVRRTLITRFHLAPDTLIAVGFGSERLKAPSSPFAPENRRVQVVNTTVTAAR